MARDPDQYLRLVVADGYDQPAADSELLDQRAW
jgi:hypothetical protein